MQFNTWLDTFIAEKKIDLEETFSLEDCAQNYHVIPYGVIVEHIKIAPKNEQAEIRSIIVRLDFKNGDVRHFLRHLALLLIGGNLYEQ